jgi:hypothetical protein
MLSNTDDASAVSTSGFSSFFNDSLSIGAPPNQLDEAVAKAKYFAGK